MLLMLLPLQILTPSTFFNSTMNSSAAERIYYWDVDGKIVFGIITDNASTPDVLSVVVNLATITATNISTGYSCGHHSNRCRQNYHPSVSHYFDF